MLILDRPTGGLPVSAKGRAHLRHVSLPFGISQLMSRIAAISSHEPTNYSQTIHGFTPVELLVPGTQEAATYLRVTIAR